MVSGVQHKRSHEVTVALLLATYPSLSLHNIGKITRRQYGMLVRQISNINVYRTTGELITESAEERDERINQEILERIKENKF